MEKIEINASPASEAYWTAETTNPGVYWSALDTAKSALDTVDATGFGFSIKSDTLPGDYFWSDKCTEGELAWVPGTTITTPGYYPYNVNSINGYDTYFSEEKFKKEIAAAVEEALKAAGILTKVKTEPGENKRPDYLRYKLRHKF